MKRLSRLQSIRKFCIQCMGGSIYLPTDCPAVKCKLYPYRLGKGGGSKGTVIRKYCLECVGTSDEVKRCSISDCPFYNFRLGSIPDLPKNLRNDPFNRSNFNDQDTGKVNVPVFTENRL